MLTVERAAAHQAQHGTHHRRSPSPRAAQAKMYSPTHSARADFPEDTTAASSLTHSSGLLGTSEKTDWRSVLYLTSRISGTAYMCETGKGRSSCARRLLPQTQLEVVLATTVREQQNIAQRVVRSMSDGRRVQHVVFAAVQRAASTNDNVSDSSISIFVSGDDCCDLRRLRTVKLTSLLKAGFRYACKTIRYAAGYLS